MPTSSDPSPLTEAVAPACRPVEPRPVRMRPLQHPRRQSSKHAIAKPEHLEILVRDVTPDSTPANGAGRRPKVFWEDSKAASNCHLEVLVIGIVGLLCTMSCTQACRCGDDLGVDDYTLVVPAGDDVGFASSTGSREVRLSNDGPSSVLES